MKLPNVTVWTSASGIPWYVAGMILFAGMDVISKTLVQTLPLAGILWVRYIFYAGFGLILVLKLSGLKGLKSKALSLQWVRGLAMLGDVALFVVSFRFLQLAEAHSIAAIAPLMVTALAVPMLGERVGRRRWTAVLLGFCGVLVILRPGSDIFQPVAILPLIATFSFSIYLVLTKIVSRQDGLGTTVFYPGLIGLVILSLIAPFKWQSPTLEEWSLLVLASLLAVGAHICVIRGLSLSDASLLQPFNYVLLLAAIILGFLVFDHFPDAITLSGAGLVVVSGLYVWWRERSRINDQGDG